MDELQGIDQRSESSSSDSSLDEELTFSPDLGLSPVTFLSGNLDHLRCMDSVSPRRKLKLSPDSKDSSPSQPESTIGTAALSAFPNESTPPQTSNKSDSSFECSNNKPFRKKAFRRIKGRDNEENTCHPDSRKKKSRMKLSDLFHSPELVTRQQIQGPNSTIMGWGTQGNGEGTEIQAGPEDQKLAMSDDINPQFNDANDEDDELIGDFSKRYCLPVEGGKHQDLKYISSKTLAHLLSGGFKDTVEEYYVVDCRYPYEYAGGHIKGAWNLYKEEQISEQFLKKPSLPQSHTVLIFHCEFSSERAPKLCRLLRNLDRKENIYPNLYYPELYLLKGGYKEFFESFEDLCEPQGYVNMLHGDYTEQLRKYHKKNKPPSGQKVRKELFKSLNSNKSFSPVTTQSLLKL
ncbi:uncharacterized protein PAF06_019962 [Gastrophryne carolinensis]